jgi:hypothetical protein
VDIQQVRTLTDIPFLPISFFKSHRITSGDFQPETVFESSGTTGSTNSKHFVKRLDIYKCDFLKTFEFFYGDPPKWCIIGLLPSYLERQSSSLVFMVDALIRQSGHSSGGFYLNEHEVLKDTLLSLEASAQNTLLLGVSFALLDFMEKYQLKLRHTVVMETGGMKGRRAEITRPELHKLLTQGFGVGAIHSEYGMTELLSQAYSSGEGIFKTPPWMKICVREDDNPLSVRRSGKGIINVIDLANIHSCSFIATDDIGIVKEDGSFEVQGRVDNSDIRGCSLMVSEL